MQPREEPPPGRPALGPRLRELRLQSEATQRSLADALEVSHSLVSSWEKGAAAPPDPRLQQLATLFAAPRVLSAGNSSLLEDQLTEDEAQAQQEIYRQLIELREAALPEEPAIRIGSATSTRLSAQGPQPRQSFWHFPDGAPVRIVCGQVPEESRGAYAEPSSPNFTRLHGFADADALIELFGHVRMVNPDSNVQFRLGAEMEEEDLTVHVILVGGLRLNPVTEQFAAASGLPVRQIEDENVENGEVFEIERQAGRRRFLPTFLEGDPAKGMTEDVGLLARMPNPNFISRTLTLCNGVFSRGVYGAVRTLTDARLRKNNEEYIGSRFDGESEFGLLFRVPVYRGKASTPDLKYDYHRLYVWTGRNAE